jgi:hypothetical protein
MKGIMSALDKLHNNVRNALIKDGWTITNDPLTLKYENRSVYVDLGAERNVLGAVRGTEKIAVEIKTFGGPSDVRDLQEALGQYLLYQNLLREIEPDRIVFLAVPKAAWFGIFKEAIGQLILDREIPYAFAFDPILEEIIEWKR